MTPRRAARVRDLARAILAELDAPPSQPPRPDGAERTLTTEAVRARVTRRMRRLRPAEE